MKGGHWRAPDGFPKGNIYVWVQEVLELFFSRKKSKGIIEEEQIPLNKTEMNFKVDSKTKSFKKEMKILD